MTWWTLVEVVFFAFCLVALVYGIAGLVVLGRLPTIQSLLIATAGFLLMVFSFWREVGR